MYVFDNFLQIFDEALNKKIEKNVIFLIWKLTTWIDIDISDRLERYIDNDKYYNKLATNNLYIRIEHIFQMQRMQKSFNNKFIIKNTSFKFPIFNNLVCKIIKNRYSIKFKNLYLKLDPYNTYHTIADFSIIIEMSEFPDLKFTICHIKENIKCNGQIFINVHKQNYSVHDEMITKYSHTIRHILENYPMKLYKK